MKPILFTVLIAFSLAANAALLLRLVRPAAFSAVVALAHSSSSSGRSQGGRAAEAGRAEHPAVAVKWEDLQTNDDLPGLAARLKAAGFPPSIVRSIVAAQLNDRYAARRKELQASTTLATLPYWKNTTIASLYGDPKRVAAQAELRSLSRQQAKELKDLLGPNPDPQDPLADFYQQRQYGSLAREKIDQLQLITQDYSDLTSQLRAATQGVTLPEDREKLAYLAKQKESDIQALLTPEEYEGYQLRNSDTAGRLRSQLVAFEPTEQEFRTIFKLQQAFDDQYVSPYMTVTPDLARERADAQKQLSAQIKDALGDDRFAEYDRSRAAGYQQTANLVSRLDLPKETALQVWNVQQDIQQRATAARTDRSLTAEARTQQLAALADEAKAKVTATLGDRGFEAYQQYAGSWLQVLKPQPAATAGGTSGTTQIISTSSGQIYLVR